MRDVTRRVFLSTALAGLGSAAWAANPPATSLIPVPRPAGVGPVDLSRPQPPRDILAEIGLPGKTSFVVADARSGEILDSGNPHLRLPPASVAKMVTAQYALETFGPDHTFKTQIWTTAPIVNGRVDGDVLLVGGGDPLLDTDELAGLADRFLALGVKEVTGRFLVHGGVLPELYQIDPEQPKHVSYNPSVGGLALNFNRVYFEWKHADGGLLVRMDARGQSHQPLIPTIQMAVVDRPGPVFDFKMSGVSENWTVAKGALRKDGAQWLPVRNPTIYVGQAMHGILAEKGLRLPAPVQISGQAPGSPVAQIESLPLIRIIRSMLYFSTNVVAEMLGLSATIARGGAPKSLKDSGAAMSRWMQTEMGAGAPRFVDHSGLGDATRVTTGDLVKALLHIGPDSAVAGVMRRKGMPKAGEGIGVVAKTGTLNFVSGLAGFADIGERDLAFAIIAADLPHRNTIPLAERERPRGAKGWSNRARHQENELIIHWRRMFG